MNSTNKFSKWKPWHKWVLAGTAGFFLIAIIAINSSDEPGKTVSADKPITAEKPIEAPYLQVSSVAYFNKYKENEVAADEMYKSRNLEVTGTVESINKDFTDDIYINLAVSDFETVKCNISPDNIKPPAEIKKGQKITVKGRGGGMIIGTPIIDNCIIQ